MGGFQEAEIGNGFRIFERVIVGEALDDFTIGGAKPRGRVMNAFARKDFDNIGKEMDAKASCFGGALIFGGFINKTGADDEVSLMAFDWFDELVM